MQTEVLLPESFPGVDSTALKIVVIYEDVASGKRAKHFAEELAQRLGSTSPLDESLWRCDLLEYPEIATEAARAVADADYLIVALHRDRVLPLAAREWIESQLETAAREDTGLSVVLLNFGGDICGWHARGDARPYLRALCAEKGLPFFCHAEARAVDEIVGMLGRPSAVPERPPHHGTAGPGSLRTTPNHHTMNPSTDPKTILVVDDCAGICELINILLSRVGYHVITATNGTEALRLARSGAEIDLLMANLEMPGMRGDEVAARFEVLHPATPVVFLSSFAAPTDPEEPHEFLAKPFTVIQLRDTVRRALRTRPARAEMAHAA